MPGRRISEVAADVALLNEPAGATEQEPDAGNFHETRRGGSHSERRGLKPSRLSLPVPLSARRPMRDGV